MNELSIMSLPALLSLVTSVLVPGVSSLLGRSANSAGVWTPVLAAVSGFGAEWAANDSFSWRSGLVLSLIGYVLAAVAHSKIWADTPLEQWLLQLGATPGASSHVPARRAAKRMAPQRA